MTNFTLMQRRQALSLLGHGAAATGLASFLAPLSAVAADDGQDFKAVVCIFLYGGNDQSNTVVPRSGSAYSTYQAARPSIALAANSLLALDGTNLGLHPSLAEVQGLYNTGKAAVVANVGTLVQPIDKAQWNSGRPTVGVPVQLFSHSDQAAHWQTGTPTQTSTTGWMGRLADAMGPSYNGSSSAPYVVSAGVPNVLTIGERVEPFQVGPTGAATPRSANYLFGAAQPANTLGKVLASSSDNLLLRHWSKIAEQSIQISSTVNTAMNSVSLSTAFPTTSIGQQLKSIAKLIAARSRLGHRRQIYFASMIGFDGHDNLLLDQAKKLKELSQAVKAFYDSTVQLGVSDRVVTFTASDFGRALVSNGKGSDHGWGSHHFVIGGSVTGGRVIGQFPTVALNGPEDAGQGRLIPRISTDQYASTIAKWFGADAPALSTALPNLRNFSTTDLGFVTG